MSDPVEPDGTTSRPTRPRLAGRHVLVADDNALNRRVLRRLLNALGCTCDEVSNGAEAVSAVAAAPGQPFDVILMDAEMPVLNGFQAARLIRAAEARTGIRTPILALTGLAFAGNTVRCAAAGMDAFLSKPVRLAELGDAVERALEASAA